jgi:hypothetical protein
VTRYPRMVVEAPGAPGLAGGAGGGAGGGGGGGSGHTVGATGLQTTGGAALFIERITE